MLPHVRPERHARAAGGDILSRVQAGFTPATWSWIPATQVVHRILNQYK
ncbi:MAG: hypothetical protein WAP58_00585 [Peptococcia bacterium]